MEEQVFFLMKNHRFVYLQFKIISCLFTVAQVNSIPWQVGIKIFNTFPFCGGTIIGPSTILTAAHCVEAAGLKPKDVKILVSEHDHTTDKETFS